MPSSVAGLLASAGLGQGGVVAWHGAVPPTTPGVYLVSLSVNPESMTGTLPFAPIGRSETSRLLSARPELTIDGTRPSPDVLTQRISEFWLPDENILYVGLAGTSLQSRIGAYYSTRLGRRSPHAGGWFLKLLKNLDQVWVHYAVSNDPAGSENQMLAQFVSGVSPASKGALRDPSHPFPFANLEWPQGVRKGHGIRGATGDAQPRVARPAPTRRQEDPSPRPKVQSGNDVGRISDHLQVELRRRERTEVTAVEAAGWLEQAGLLIDSEHRPGLPLRNLLRAGQIQGQRQESNHRWFIDRVDRQ